MDNHLQIGRVYQEREPVTIKRITPQLQSNGESNDRIGRKIHGAPAAKIA